MADYILEILKQAIGPLIAGLFVLWTWLKERPSRQQKLKSEEMNRMKILLDEIQEERDKSRLYNAELEEKIKELRKTIEEYNGKIKEYQSEREMIIKKMIQLEKENTNILEEQERERDEALVRDKSQSETITGLREEIVVLRKQINGVERTTKELEMKTGPLPKTKRN